MKNKAIEIGKQIQYETTRNGSKPESISPECQLLLNEMSYETQICLLSNTELTDADMNEIIEECGDHMVAWFGLLMIDEELSDSLTRSSFSDCLMEATGADIITAIGGQLGDVAWKSLSKTVLKKALKQAAKAVIGPAGVAIIVCEFAWCMLR